MSGYGPQLSPAAASSATTDWPVAPPALAPIEGAPAIAAPRLREPRWDLAFLGLLAYLIVEYSRLPAR
jgi:hypothetical protein